MENWLVYEMVRGMNSVDLLCLLLIQFLTASFKIGQGNAIQCFVCNSKSDPRCADPIQTDWQGSDDSDSDDSDENSDKSLIPVECHLAVQYSAGIQAVSDILRGFGHPRLGVPDLWLSTSAALSPNTGSNTGGFSGGSNGYGNRGYGGRGGYRGTPWGTLGGQRDQDDSMGCHKVVYTDNNGDSVVDRGCAPARVTNMDPCSALDAATSSNDNGNGNTGNSGNNNVFSGSGHNGGAVGGGGGGGGGGSFDMSQISADFCEVCNDGDGCNTATNITSVNFVLLSLCLLALNNYRYIF